jgi:acyl-CoA oxidase
MNQDLLKERCRATFCTERVTNFLDGGSKERTARRRYIEDVIANDPTGVFDNSKNAYLHRTERHVRALAKAVRVVEIGQMIGILSSSPSSSSDSPMASSSATSPLFLHKQDFYTLLGAIADDLPLALHWIMFIPNILSLCDDEQIQRWIPLCLDWKMIGCYAQTELGHGSNVRALQTTATFLHERDGGQKGGSWIIHTPTLTATKFWPGTLGRTANHAMVIAQLIDGKGKRQGIHNFLVPLRSMTDHQLLKGVTTGDIGPKIGYNNMDNGFASFDNVIIPRRNMAMRFATVDEEGNYSTKVDASGPASKIAYISMMQVRSYIIDEAGKHLAMACTIAIRYSAVRRQGFATTTTGPNKEGGAEEEEVQVLDYTQQQHRLLPLLAATYCFFFTGKNIIQQLQSMEQKILHDDGLSSVITKEQVGDIHASTSCLKSFCTSVVADGIEDCRKACGGHGYLHASGLPEMLQSYLQNPTVEGDNYMLPQQTVRTLLKIVVALQHSSPTNTTTKSTTTTNTKTKSINDIRDAYKGCDSAYLIDQLCTIMSSSNRRNSYQPIHSIRWSATNMEEMKDLNNLTQAFQHRAARLLLNLSDTMQEQVSSGTKTAQECWNDSLVEMHRVSKAHSLAILLNNATQRLTEEAQSSTSSTSSWSSCLGTNEIDVLRELIQLFGLYWIEKDMGDFLEDGYMNQKQSMQVRTCVLDLLKCLRLNAVALVDARDFSDFRLKSALGRFDGNVYPALMQSALNDPLNSTDPGPGNEHLRRLIVDGVGVTATASRL